MVVDLESEHPDPWSLSIQQVIFRAECKKEREQRETIRGAISASVPQMSEKDQKKFWDENE